jgi:hypothetical protein
MTEEEWLAGAVPFREALRTCCRDLDARRRRLFLCACLRQTWALLEEASRHAVEVAERYADGLAPEKERDQAWSRCLEVRFLGVGGAANQAVLLAAGPDARLSVEGITTACALAVDALVIEAERQLACGLLEAADCDDLAVRLRQAQEALFRDIVGDPFRSPRLEASWLTANDGLVPRLAEEIYDERLWADLPVLGDALEDAGCTNDDLLDHCHGPGPYTRGCWALDLVTGKGEV